MSNIESSALSLAKGPFSALLQHRSLSIELAKRDVLGRYRGASFGMLWSLISPFLMLMVYTFAFGSLMKSRWPQIEHGQASYSVILFVGLIVHGFFAECFNRAPSLVTGNPNFVKRVIFPLEILPWSTVSSALFNTFMNFIVFLALNLAMGGALTWTILLAPVVFAPLVILTLGVCWLLAAFGVYLRDISQVTGVVATVMLFLSSAMFPIKAIPEQYRILFELNPLTFIIDQMREVALWGNLPDWGGLLVYTLLSIVVFYLGFACFHFSRKGFADVL